MANFINDLYAGVPRGVLKKFNGNFFGMPKQ